MQLNPSGGLTSVLAALFPGVDARSAGVTGSPASEFEHILARLSAVFENPGQGHSTVLRVPPGTSRLERWMDDLGAEEGGKLLENLSTLGEHLKAAVQSAVEQAQGVLPDAAVNQDTQVAVTSTDQKLEPAPLVISQLKDLAAESEVAKPVETGVLVKSGSLPESAAPGGSSQTDFQAPGPGSDPKSYGMGVPPPLTLGEVAGPTFTPSSMLQGGDRPVMELHQPLGHPEWADELGQRLIWIHGKSIQAAEIRINPPELGPVAVRIQIHDDQTSIQFASPHAAVREAIEAALPRLKELFDARQLPLTQVEVAQQSLEDRSHSHARREQPHAAAQDYQVNAREEELEESEQERGRLKVNIGSRLLSLYA